MVRRSQNFQNPDCDRFHPIRPAGVWSFGDANRTWMVIHEQMLVPVRTLAPLPGPRFSLLFFSHRRPLQ